MPTRKNLFVSLDYFLSFLFGLTLAQQHKACSVLYWIMLMYSLKSDCVHVRDWPVHSFGATGKLLLTWTLNLVWSTDSFPNLFVYFIILVTYDDDTGMNRNKDSNNNKDNTNNDSNINSYMTVVIILNIHDINTCP